MNKLKKFITLFSLAFFIGLTECSLLASAVEDRVECAADHPTNKTICEERGCIYDQKSKAHGNGFSPTCYFPSDFLGYKVIHIKNDPSRIVLALERQRPSGFPKDVKAVLVEITPLNDRMVRLKFIDKDERRYEVPLPKLNIPNKQVNNPLYSVKVEQNGKVTITRKSTGSIIFSTNLSQLIYSDQFLQLNHLMSSNNIYGLGEHKAPFRKNNTWQYLTIFNRDQGPTDYTNLYGSHAVYLSVDNKTGLSDSVFLFNSNAMDVILQPRPSITWRPIGGILDFYVILGNKPSEVISEYIKLIGKPSMPPLWGLGFHLCRCCHQPSTLEKQKVITQRMIDAKIPFDVQWNAKEFMVRNNMFTLNEQFSGLKEFISHLHSIGMHYLTIADPGIGVERPGVYAPYDDGMAMDIFIKNISGKPLIGNVWNYSGKTVFADFSSPKGMEYWIKWYKHFHSMVPVDGVWNDMNEVAGRLVSGSLWGCPNSTLEYPPYVPGSVFDPKKFERNTIWAKTICMTAKQYAGIQYNIHDLYPLYEAVVTHKAMTEIRGKRPFIISRSTFVGQGKYSGHWTGDIVSNYDQMEATVAAIQNFNLFGIPLVGSDICGHLGNVKNDTWFQHLCARWQEVGSFYPFSRNHNMKPIDQDPAALGQTVIKSTKTALEKRYSLIAFLYTLFYRAQRFGETVIRPLFFEFPQDIKAYENDNQFLWGSSVMIMPVLTINVTKINAYFPSGNWYLYEANGLNSIERVIKSKGEYIHLDAPIEKINIAVRGGSILPILPPKTTTTEIRKQNFTLLVALDDNESANGELFWDDGDSLDPVDNGRYNLVSFDAKNNEMVNHVLHLGFDDKMPLESVSIVGLNSEPKGVTLNGKAISFIYSPGLHQLTLEHLNVDLRKKFVISWV